MNEFITCGAIPQTIVNYINALIFQVWRNSAKKIKIKDYFMNTIPSNR